VCLPQNNLPFLLCLHWLPILVIAMHLDILG